MPHCAGIGTSYTEALAKLNASAEIVKASRKECDSLVRVSLGEAVGRVAAGDCVSPMSTPEFDTSAMDGYALRSEATKGASVQRPVYFRVQGTIAAGDDPSVVMDVPDAGAPDGGIEPCTEIMTGARFPTSGLGQLWDACVRVEDVLKVGSKKSEGFHELVPSAGAYIAITKPVAPMANRRIAGEDIRKGNVILKQGNIIRSSHLLPLASVGVRSLLVQAKPSVYVWSTGNELVSGPACIPDVNGLFLTSASREYGANSTFLGVLEDSADEIASTISQILESSQADVLITSGGVSVGKFDHIRKALDLMGAEIIFHGLAIRPGHPALFALLNSSRGKVAFFGLPGNPGAAAACFRFLVIPYLRSSMGQEAEKPIPAILMNPGSTNRSDHLSNGNKPRMDCPGRDVFRPGILHTTEEGENICSEVSGRHSPSLLSPYVDANCWMHFKQNSIQGPRTSVDCYPTSPTALG